MANKAFSGSLIIVGVMVLMITAIQASFADHQDLSEMWELNRLVANDKVKFSAPLEIPEPGYKSSDTLKYPRESRNPPEPEVICQHLHQTEDEGPNEVNALERGKASIEVATWEKRVGDKQYIYVKYSPDHGEEPSNAWFYVSLDPSHNNNKYAFANGVTMSEDRIVPSVQPGGLATMEVAWPIAVRPKGYDGPLYLHWGIMRAYEQ